ncbi:hypothetical protein Gotur_013781 [Gossypium turneri]
MVANPVAFDSAAAPEPPRTDHLCHESPKLVNSSHQVLWSSKTALLFVVLNVQRNERRFVFYPLVVREDLKQRKPYTITKQRERWTEEEHNRFLEALKLYGRAWQRIEGVYLLFPLSNISIAAVILELLLLWAKICWICLLGPKN